VGSEGWVVLWFGAWRHSTCYAERAVNGGFKAQSRTQSSARSWAEGKTGCKTERNSSRRPDSSTPGRILIWGLSRALGRDGSSAQSSEPGKAAGRAQDSDWSNAKSSETGSAKDSRGGGGHFSVLQPILTQANDIQPLCFQGLVRSRYHPSRHSLAVPDATLPSVAHRLPPVAGGLLSRPYPATSSLSLLRARW